MSDDFTVRGAEDFLRLSKAMKAAGQSGLRNELNRAVRQAAQPLIVRTREAARRELPQRGGLAARYARQPQRVRTRTGATTAGVSIVLKGQPGITSGRIRHPVFGHRDRFVTQQVSGTWWDDTLEGSAPEVQQILMDVLGEFAERLAQS